jgi:hypothetical protein
MFANKLPCSTVLVAILRTDTHRARDQECHIRLGLEHTSHFVRLKRVTDKNADCELAAERADWKEQIN